MNFLLWPFEHKYWLLGGLTKFLHFANWLFYRAHVCTIEYKDVVFLCFWCVFIVWVHTTVRRHNFITFWNRKKPYTFHMIFCCIHFVIILDVHWEVSCQHCLEKDVLLHLVNAMLKRNWFYAFHLLSSFWNFFHSVG